MWRILHASRKIPTICLFFSYKNNIFAPVAHNKCCISWWLNKQIAIQCHKSRLSWKEPLHFFSLYYFPYPAVCWNRNIRKQCSGEHTIKKHCILCSEHLSCLYWGGFLTLLRVSWAAYQHSKEVCFCLPVVASGLAHMQQRMQYKSARNNDSTFCEPRICGRTWVRPSRKTINILRNLTGAWWLPFALGARLERDALCYAGIALEWYRSVLCDKYWLISGNASGLLFGRIFAFWIYMASCLNVHEIAQLKKWVNLIQNISADCNAPSVMAMEDVLGILYAYSWHKLIARVCRHPVSNHSDSHIWPPHFFGYCVVEPSTAGISFTRARPDREKMLPRPYFVPSLVRFGLQKSCLVRWFQLFKKLSKWTF